MTKTGHIEQCYSLFQQPWWLDTVASEKWNAITVEKGNEIRARLPIIEERKMGFSFCTMPPLTPRLGPWIKPQKGKYVNRLTNEKRYIEKLIEQLPDFDFFRQNFHPEQINWLPFHWDGYAQTTRYTYIIENIKDPDQVWDGIKGNIRREIRKASDIITIVEHDNAETLWDLHKMTFERQGEKPNQPKSMVEAVTQQVLKRECGMVLVAKDQESRPHAAILVVWDANSAYYLLGGADPELRNSGASSYLLWTAIKKLSQTTRKFDFEGSMIKPIERFFRGFGAKQVPYFQITKSGKKLDWLISASQVFSRLIR